MHDCGVYVIINLVIYIPQLKVGDGMENAKIITDIQEKYDSLSREQILNNLNIAISLGKTKGMDVDRYCALPKIANRSKHTVMSWFNRPHVKIALFDLCMIARYLNYNIYTFFTVRNDEAEVKVGDFLVANEYNNSHYPTDSADIFIRAYNLQYETSKDIVLDNLEKYYGTSAEILAHHLNIRQKTIMEICGCTKQTYYAWFNRSRKNVKIPLIPLCRLVLNIDMDIFDVFKSNSE